MPLDAERETAVGALDGLGQLVERGAARDHEALAEGVDPLVVVGLGDVHLLPRGARGERARVEAHVVVGVGERADGAPVVAVADDLAAIDFAMAYVSRHGPLLVAGEPVPLGSRPQDELLELVKAA